MDFVDLADGLQQVTVTVLRHLATTTAATTNIAKDEDSGDDDFARIDGDGYQSAAAAHHHQEATSSYYSTAVPFHQQQDSYSSSSSSSSSTEGYSYYSPDDINIEAQHPFLSKSAEAELYLLATNFLLYVAMVIITTIVAKIYFPESLDRGIHGTPQARTFSYRVAEDVDDYYGSDDENDNAEKAVNDFIGTDNSANRSDDDADDENEVLDSDEGEGDSSGDDENNNNDGNDGAPNDKAEEETNDLLSEMRPKNSSKRPGVSFANKQFMEFEQMTLSKAEVMKRLSICIVMLNLTFVTWGVLQERMLTRRYPRYTGEYFTYSYALVFTSRFWTLIMSGLLLLYLKPRRSQTTVIYEYSFPAISNMLSSWCQYEALQYVSFPATTLFKSFKLAPVMAMGKILGNKSYPQYDYIVALWIGIGITMFMASTDDLSFGYDYLGEKARAKWTGVMLLFLFLFFDSFTSQFQSRMFQHHRDLSIVELMFATSAFSTVLSAITLVHTKELYPAIAFVYEHSEIHLHFFMFSCCSTIGQLFIYYTIKNFGAVVFTLIMTTRILLSIALSCVLYGHQVTATGFFGLVVVMGAVLYRIKKKAQGQQLVKWQGMEDDKAIELVQEWHEHIDF